MNGRPAPLRLLQYGLVAAAGLLVAAPFVGFALNSFSFRWFYPQLVPRHWSLVAWERIFSPGSRLPEALANSTLLAAGVVLASLLIGLPAARALGLYRFRGRRLVEFAVLSPIMVPPLAVGMGLSHTLLRLGLGGTLAGVALVHLVPVLPYVVFTLAGIFANYPLAFEEQARTLGAGPVRVFLRITLPAIFPGLVVAGLFAFLISWSQYLLTMLVGGGRVITMPVLLFSLVPGGDNAAIAVQALLFVAPALLVLALTSRALSGRSSIMGGLGGP
jgi:putative spermidine/putrescine transport system permease protein